MIFKHQQLAQIVALILMSAFFVFIGGYYWGKKTTLESLICQFSQDSFADKVSYSLCSLYDQSNDAETTDNTENQDNESQDAESQEQEEEGQEQAYFAQLAGFGSKTTAQRFADLLKQNNFKVSIVEKKSRTSKGKIITWYQVVTEYFSDEKELAKCIEQINKISKLTDVKVVTLKPENTSERQNS